MQRMDKCIIGILSQVSLNGTFPTNHHRLQNQLSNLINLRMYLLNPPPYSCSLAKWPSQSRCPDIPAPLTLPRISEKCIQSVCDRLQDEEIEQEVVLQVSPGINANTCNLQDWIHVSVLGESRENSR